MNFIEKSLLQLLNEFGEDTTQELLSDFICSKNRDVEDFIRNKAIIHEKRGLAKTVIVFDSKLNCICGYYTISIKSFILESSINSSLKKKYFGTSQTSGNIIPSILIGQLGKNESSKSSFTGSNLMDLIFRYIAKMSVLTPSMICYVEHDGHEKVVQYYENHDFVPIVREKEEKEKGLYCHIIKTKDILNKLSS